MTLALSDRAPRQIRHSLEARYVGLMERSLLDDLTVLTSELVSNAVQHSGCAADDPLTVQATVADGVLRVEVRDSGDGVGELVPRSTRPPSGLGLVEKMSDRWSSGVTRSFQVWFEIDVVIRNEMLCRAG